MKKYLMTFYYWLPTGTNGVGNTEATMPLLTMQTINEAEEAIRSKGGYRQVVALNFVLLDEE